MKLLKLIVGIIVLVSFASSCDIISPDKELTLPIDVPAVTLTSSYSLNGEPFSVGIYDKAFFSLRNPDSGDTVALGDSNDQSHNTLVIPGVYDVVYNYTRGWVPKNQDAVVRSAVAIQTDLDLDIDVSSVEITLHFTLNGKAFPTSIDNTAEFYLEPISGGERTLLGNTYQAGDSILILPGTYNVIYSHLHGSGVPQNQDAIVKAAVNIDADQVLEVDVPAVTLKSTYTVNGEPFPVSQYERAFFSLRNPDSGDTVELGWCYQQSHDTLIIPGVYDVVYAYTQGSEIPQNQNAIVMSDVNIGSSQALAIDVPSDDIINPSLTLAIDVSAVTLTSSYSLNGEPFSQSQYTTAFFSLRNPDSGDTIALCDSHDQQHSHLIIPGVYDVVYAHTLGSEIPQNKEAIVMSDVNIDSSQALEIDVPAVTLTSSYTMNGDPFPQSQYDTAFFSLRNPASGDTVALGDSHEQPHNTLVIPGVYDVVYAYIRGWVPQNQDAIVMSDVDISSSQDLAVDVSAVTLKSTYTVNGEPFPVSQYERAFFSLRNPDSGDTVELGWCYQQSHDTLIIPGVYDVVYAYTQGSEIPQNQNAIVMSDVNIGSSQALAIDVTAVS